MIARCASVKSAAPRGPAADSLQCGNAVPPLSRRARKSLRQGPDRPVHRWLLHAAELAADLAQAGIERLEAHEMVDDEIDRPFFRTARLRHGILGIIAEVAVEAQRKEIVHRHPGAGTAVAFLRHS